MLTVVAWMVFVPAVVWNMLFFAIAFKDTVYNGIGVWANKANIQQSVISLVILFVPGVYLFGVY